MNTESPTAHHVAMSNDVNAVEPEDVADIASLPDRVDAMCRVLEQRLLERHPHTSNNPIRYVPEYDRPGIYLRIVSTGNGSPSVHAFVDQRTGDLIKAATWKAPQKDRNGNLAVRFNLLDDTDFARLLELCDPHGAHLYVR